MTDDKTVDNEERARITRKNRPPLPPGVAFDPMISTKGTHKEFDDRMLGNTPHETNPRQRA
jgi:hypothetical protein